MSEQTVLDTIGVIPFALTHGFDDIVLDKWVVGPAVEGEVGGA